MRILTIDLETENHEYLGSTASPHCPENYVVLVGYAYDDGPRQYQRFNSLEEFKASQWLPDLTDVWLIVAHNAMYETSWFLCHAREPFEAFLRRGGRVWCTMYAEYLLSGQTEMYPPLDEVAPKYGGTHKVDGVKILWEQGHLTSQIDPDLLLEYLIGDEGDIENTRRVFYGQYAKAVEYGMLDMFWERFDAAVAYSYCEFFGLYVDRAVAERNLQEQRARIDELRAGLQQLLPELPEHFEFNWNSDYHLSALIFGGGVKYQTRVPYDPPKYEKVDCYQTADGTYVPVELADPHLPPNAPLDTVHQYVTYASGKNKGQLKVFRVDSNVEKLKWADAIFQFPGIARVPDLPPVLREKYSGRGEFIGARTLGDGHTPVYSTGTDSLNALVTHGFEQLRPLVELAALEKDTGTYYETVKYNPDGSVKERKGMLVFVGPDGIVHHRLNVTATVTARLSSSNPNLQNLPRDGTSKVKQMFTSRFGADGYIIEVDYSALEVVMGVAFSRDMNLLAELMKGTDMHCLRLAGKLYGVTSSDDPMYHEVVRIVGDKDDPKHKEFKQMRTDIKPRAFAAQYGATAGGIAFNTGCTVEEAEEFLRVEKELFPATYAYRDVIRKEVERTGSLPENLHREMLPDGTWGLYRRGYWTSPAGTRYSFRQTEQWKEGPDGKKHKVMDYKDTQLANYWCQGEAGFMMAVAMGQIMRWMVQNHWFGNRACLINNVHDAAYADAHADVAVQVARGMRAIMQSMPAYLTSKWPAYDMLSIPFPAAAEMGPSMYEKSHVD